MLLKFTNSSNQRCRFRKHQCDSLSSFLVAVHGALLNLPNAMISRLDVFVALISKSATQTWEDARIERSGEESVGLNDCLSNG